MLENEVENLKVTLKTEVWIEGLELLSDEQEKLNVGFVQSTSDKSLQLTGIAWALLVTSAPKRKAPEMFETDLGG